MTNDQLEKLRQILADFYKLLSGSPRCRHEFMKKKIEELGGRIKFLAGHGSRWVPAEKFLGCPFEKRHRGFDMTGYHQDDTGIYIMHVSYACCILDEDLANKILLLGMPS